MRRDGYPRGQEPVARCPDCGKVRYLSRLSARKAAGRHKGGKRMRVYQCGDFWHIASWQPPGRIEFYRERGCA